MLDNCWNQFQSNQRALHLLFRTVASLRPKEFEKAKVCCDGLRALNIRALRRSHVAPNFKNRWHNSVSQPQICQIQPPSCHWIFGRWRKLDSSRASCNFDIVISYDCKSLFDDDHVAKHIMACEQVKPLPTYSSYVKANAEHERQK